MSASVLQASHPAFTPFAKNSNVSKYQKKEVGEEHPISRLDKEDGRVAHSQDGGGNNSCLLEVSDGLRDLSMTCCIT